MQRTLKMKSQNIKLGLMKIVSDEKWQEDDTSAFGLLPTKRWVAHYEVTLLDYYAKAELERSRWERFKAKHSEILSSQYNSGGALGEVFGFTVCSPAFKQDPTDDYSSDDVKKALIQDHLDEAAARNYIKNRIDSIGNMDINGIAKQLRQFLELDDEERGYWSMSTNKLWDFLAVEIAAELFFNEIGETDNDSSPYEYRWSIESNGLATE